MIDLIWPDLDSGPNLDQLTYKMIEKLEPSHERDWNLTSVEKHYLVFFSWKGQLTVYEPSTPFD